MIRTGSFLGCFSADYLSHREKPWRVSLVVIFVCLVPVFFVCVCVFGVSRLVFSLVTLDHVPHTPIWLKLSVFCLFCSFVYHLALVVMNNYLVTTILPQCVDAPSCPFVPNTRALPTPPPRMIFLMRS